VKKRKYQVETVTLANTTAATVIADVIKTLDNGYDRCVGIGISDAGSSNNYKIGFKVQNEWVIDPIPQDALEVNAAQNADARFLPVNFESRNQNITIRTQPLAEVSGDTVVQIIFVLEKDE
jgi:hypothetical protein